MCISQKPVQDYLYNATKEQKYVDALFKVNEAQSWAEHDALTGLYNRLAYAQLGENYYERNKGNVFFLYIDMDRLKYINDTEGHEAGNVYIRSFAEKLKKNFVDWNCYRVSGDEFIVVYSGEDEADFSQGKLSATTPIAKALIGHGKGETVEAQVPSGVIKFKILDISF